MGIQFCSRHTIPHLLITMKFLSTLCLAASASAMALEDTADVKAAKATFNAAFMAAEAGEHAALAPAPVASSYLADSADVAAAKADFAAAFAAAEAGEHAALAPKPVEPLPMPALPAYAAPFYGGFYGGYHNGFYPYAHGAAYPYAYGGYPYAFAPYAFVKPAAEE